MALPVRKPGSDPKARATTGLDTRPRLELSGPKLSLAFESLAAGAEDTGGIERYVDALKLKGELFARTLAEGLREELALQLERVDEALDAPAVLGVRDQRLERLDERDGTSDTDTRVDDFCAAFPRDRAHRWVRDLAVEVLHQADPERYPLMTRWTWDAATNTGVLREIWHGDDVDHHAIEVPDRYETFVVLREELAQFLAGQGVFRDVLFYVDLLAARVYADYIQEHGGSYLRADFSNAEEPMVHVRRLLGLDGIAEDGRTRLKAADGTAVVIDELGPGLLAQKRQPG